MLVDRYIGLACVVAFVIGCAPKPAHDPAPPEPMPPSEPVVFIEVPAVPQEPESAAAETSAPEPSPEDKERAKQLYMEGARLYQEADIAGALERFEQAYALTPMPALAYNIARCLDQLGRVQDACAAYRHVVAAGDDDMRDAADDALMRLGC